MLNRTSLCFCEGLYYFKVITGRIVSEVAVHQTYFSKLVQGCQEPMEFDVQNRGSSIFTLCMVDTSHACGHHCLKLLLSFVNAFDCTITASTCSSTGMKRLCSTACASCFHILTLARKICTIMVPQLIWNWFEWAFTLHLTWINYSSQCLLLLF